MKNLMKTLVCGILVLSVISCRSNDDDFTNIVKTRQAEATRTIELIPNKKNKLILSVHTITPGGEPGYTYKLYKMIKSFKFTTTKEDKVVRIHYNISFRFETEDRQGNYEYEHIERLVSRLSKIDYNDTEVINVFVYNTGVKELKRVYDTKIKVTIHTESGKTYSRLIDDVEVKF